MHKFVNAFLKPAQEQENNHKRCLCKYSMLIKLLCKPISLEHVSRALASIAMTDLKIERAS